MPTPITIGIPFLNAEATLGDAIRSVFAQTHRDWRLVLVDDGSRDGSLAVARGVRDSRVQVLSDGENRGLVARLNALAAACDTPYLARMDADDLMVPERLERQLAFLRAHPETDVLGSAAVTFRGTAPRGIRGGTLCPTTVAAVLRGGLYVHPTVVFRAEFARANPYDPAYPRAEDLELWCRIVERARCAVLPEPLLLYREPVPVNLRAYAGTARTRLRILGHYGDTLPARDRAALRLRVIASVWVHRAAAWSGLEGLLLDRRSAPLSPAQAAAARVALEAVLATEVPGLPSTWTPGRP